MLTEKFTDFLQTEHETKMGVDRSNRNPGTIIQVLSMN